jgi:hypothetical protein
MRINVKFEKFVAGSDYLRKCCFDKALRSSGKANGQDEVANYSGTLSLIRHFQLLGDA